MNLTTKNIQSSQGDYSNLFDSNPAPNRSISVGTSALLSTLNIDLTDGDYFDADSLQPKHSISKSSSFPLSESFQENETSNSHRPDYKSELTRVINSLPNFLQDVCMAFSNVDEQEIALLAGTIITGGTMPLVRINYDNKINYPALMLFICRPPASGKGSIALLKKLSKKVDEYLTIQANEKLNIYKMELDKYNAAIKKGLPAVIVIKPKMPLFMSSGNITSAKLMDQLYNNGSENMLVICEPEADMLGLSGKGGFNSLNSSYFRLAYQHEQISAARKNDDSLQVVSAPKLAMVIAGTENQFRNIFQGNEDGLYSRFLVIHDTGTAAWRNPKPCVDCPPIDDKFEQLSLRFYNLWVVLSKLNVEVRFSNTQWDELNAFGLEKFNHAHHFTGEETSSLAIRHCTMIVRLASIITMVRYYEDQRSDEIIYCVDNDFQIALWLTKRSLTASLNFFTNLPHTVDKRPGSLKTAFFNNLPSSFDAQCYTALGISLGITARTAQRHIQSFVKTKALLSPQKGHYTKEQAGINAANSSQSNY